MYKNIFMGLVNSYKWVKSHYHVNLVNKLFQYSQINFGFLLMGILIFSYIFFLHVLEKQWNLHIIELPFSFFSPFCQCKVFNFFSSHRLENVH